MRVLKKLVPVLFLCLCFAINADAQDKLQKEKDGDVFVRVDEMPEYPGGESALRKDIAEEVSYPLIAKEQGISGKVYVTFVVNEQGKVVDSKIARGVDPSLDKEALRVMNTLKTWTPGKQKGQAVKVSYTVPINFELGENFKVNKKIDVYYTAEEMPKYPGGEEALRKFLAENVKYPVVAKKEGIQGKVYVSFMIDVDGTVDSVVIARGVDPSLDKESIRVVSLLSDWTPGRKNGEPVKVSYTVPINYALSDEKE
jgi:TonB family protein